MRTPVGLGQQGCAPLLALVNRGARGGGCKSLYYYSKYSTLKREIKRRLNTNQKHSNKATHRELSLNKTLSLHYFILKINICRHFNFPKMYEWPDLHENE